MKPTRRTNSPTSTLVRALLIAAVAACASAAAPQSHARQNPSTQQAPTAAQSPASPQTSATPEPGLTLLTVSVTDSYGRYISGLGRERFSIHEGDTQHELLYFDADDAPRSVGIVFDVSRSMGGPALDVTRLAVANFIKRAHRSNEYFIVAFDGRARLMTDWTQDPAALVEGLNKLARVEQRKSGTALYDALSLATEKVARGTRRGKVILLVSDGRDTASDTKSSAVREMLRRSGVTLYAVRVEDRNAASPDLDELAGVAGGRVFRVSTTTEVEDSFERIALELHNLYTVGFRPAAADGKWHKLRVKVQPPPKWPSMFVRTREGYYADEGAGN